MNAVPDRHTRSGCLHTIPRRAAFTLVELLVVIAIIIILASLVTPVVRSALDRGRAVACLSNMRQVGLGLIAYVGDHDGLTPAPYDPSKTWSSWGGQLFIGGYITDNSVFDCPSHGPKSLGKWDKDQDPSDGDNRLQAYTYGLREALPGGYGGWILPTRLTSIEKPSTYFLISECVYLPDPEYLFYTMDDWHSAAMIHNKKANAFFADGSTRAVGTDYFDTVDWGKRVQPVYYWP